MTAERAAVVVLIRHGSTASVEGRLCGRTPGVPLDARGRREAEGLAREFSRVPLAAVYSSPMQRALETAAAIAAVHRLVVEVFEPLNEVDFGEWTGASFDALAEREDWRRYNEARQDARVPGGEAPAGTLSRVAAALSELGRRHAGQIVAAVTHAEIVRYAVLLARGASLDKWDTVRVPTASVVPLLCGRSRIGELAHPRRADTHPMSVNP